MTFYVSVSKNVIQRNFENRTNNPPYEIRRSKQDQQPVLVNEAVFVGTIRLVYDCDNPLVSGAVCWLEVDES